VSRRLVLDLRAQRPVWRVPPDVVAAVRRALGESWEVREVEAPAISDGDGGAGGSAEAIAAARGAEVYFGFGAPAGVVQAGRDTLRWVHTCTAGVGASLPELQRSGILLTNSAGVHAEPIADWVLAAIAHFARGLDYVVRAQAERRWIQGAFGEREIPVRELADLRVGILGLGGIGSAVARRALALGMRVAGVRRHPQRGGPDGLRWVGGQEALGRLAGESDALVIAAPRTTLTDGLVSKAVLDGLPTGAVVVNVSRGALLDQDALLAALEEGRLRGAALDVFGVEPLPSADPLWGHPRVLVSPHISPVTDRFWERESGLILENIPRYLAGTPLVNLVDASSGY
jgi:phosphoglycerate dehydrogenase-like enzyme